MRRTHCASQTILCHLRDVDMEVNLPRLNKVLHEVNPFLPGEDTDPWAKDRNYILQDCDEALDRFIITRMEIVSMLETLSPDDWERSARHAIFGPTRLIELVKIITGHDRLHVQQAHEVLGVMSDPAQICDFMK